MIKHIPINDGWLYRKGFTQDCLEREFDWSDSFIVQIPHNIECESRDYFDERNMRALSTYSRVLTVPESYNGKRLLLSLEGVLSYVEVYVNGIFVTSHKGESPFVADITAPVKYEYENRIVLKVDSNLRAEVPCCGTRGPLALFGGICRDVVFMICDGRDIRDVCVRTYGAGNSRTVTADVEMFDYYPDTELDGEIFDSDGNSVGSLAARSVQGNSVRLKGECAQIQCWSPDSPALYTASVRLKSGKKILDCKSVAFGFVSAEFKRDGFYLNGKPTKLIGLLRADCYPSIGRSATGETERRDARIIKAAGCNAVRTMGQAGRDFIDECNRIGLMVIEDVYGDGYVGGAEWKDAFLTNVTDMVTRDRNNPSVIAWGVRVNNSGDSDELYFKAHKTAKEADPTRATLGARNFLASRPIEDVFAFNETYRPSRKKRKTGKLFVPFLLGEHCGKNRPARTYDAESVRLEQALRHIEAINDTLGGSALGAFGMSFCDFATGRGRGNGDSVNNYGVFDQNRNPKLAAYAYISQTDTEPVLELSSNLSADDYTGKLYVFTNADKIVMYRNDVKVGEYFPDRKRWQHLKHPPVVIDDFAGELPACELGSGFKLKLFKSLLKEYDRKGACLFGFLNSRKEALLRIFGKYDRRALGELLEKYSRVPPNGAKYTFEAVYGGEVKKTRTLSPDIVKTLRVQPSCERELVCSKSYERIAFSLFAEDGFGNVLDYCFMPVSVHAGGSLAIEGANHLSLEGGRGGFFARSVSPGIGVVTVRSELGVREFEFECKYDETERF